MFAISYFCAQMIFPARKLTGKAVETGIPTREADQQGCQEEAEQDCQQGTAKEEAATCC